MFRIDALEGAMHRDRTWATADFRRCWVEHRLMRHLARRVVWAARGPNDVTLFRIAEDGTYANANDELIDLEGADVIGVPHPMRWPTTQLESWRERFDDYELLQPFEQLNRPVPEIRDSELDSPRIERTAPSRGDLERSRFAGTGA